MAEFYEARNPEFDSNSTWRFVVKPRKFRKNLAWDTPLRATIFPNVVKFTISGVPYSILPQGAKFRIHWRNRATCRPCGAKMKILPRRHLNIGARPAGNCYIYRSIACCPISSQHTVKISLRCPMCRLCYCRHWFIVSLNTQLRVFHHVIFHSTKILTRRPAWADRTARREFQAGLRGDVRL